MLAIQLAQAEMAEDEMKEIKSIKKMQNEIKLSK